MSEEAMVTKSGALSMQVCVPSEWTDEQTETFANEKVLCGTTHGWKIRPDGHALLNGDKYRVKCDGVWRDGFVHIMLDA